jgi:hemerythrin-like domain-containing protein
MPITIGQGPENGYQNPLGLLSDCHRRIERFLDIILAIAEQANGKDLEEDQRTALELALRYFREAAPKHVLDEEESLFPRLRAKQSPTGHRALALLDKLNADHRKTDRGHKGIEELSRVWLKEGCLPPDDATLLARLLQSLRETYRQHIAVEDAEVFPLASRLLDGAELQTIGQEMAARRGLSLATIGEGPETSLRRPLSF